MADKANRRSLTEKLEAIRRVHNGESKASVARDIKVPGSTLKTWCKNEDKLSHRSSQLEKLAMQPLNLNLRSSERTYLLNFSVDNMKNDTETPKSALNLSTNIETPKLPNQMGERNRNRTELRLNVELNPNRPSGSNCSIQSTNNLAKLTNIGLLPAQWSDFLQQQQQQQEAQQLQANKSKFTAPADMSTHMVPSIVGMQQSISRSQAVEHGEKFLKWLEEACDYPTVTVVEIIQFKKLLDDIKSRRRSKNKTIEIRKWDEAS